MILICEITFDRGAHVPFNAGLLATIRAAFPKEDLAFYGAAAHIEQLKAQVGSAAAGSILWKHIVPIPPGASYGERLPRELNVIRQLFRELPQDSTSRLILTSAFPSTVLAIKVARWFQSGNPAVQLVLHGMSGVIGKRRRHPLYRFQDMNTALTLLGNNGIQYLVLEESIRDYAVTSLPQLKGRIEAFEHPISPNEGASEVVALTEPIRFGFLGTALKSKGYSLFVEVANTITAKFGRRAEFHVIGRCPEESRSVKGTDVLTTQPASAQLTREEFIRGVAPLHFIVLPYEAANYTLSASGVLLDAIAWQKPVIARGIPPVRAMFQKYGEIGHLFDQDSELSAIIEQILHASDTSRYRRQVLKLWDVRKARNPETLAAAYRELCVRSEDK